MGCMRLSTDPDRDDARAVAVVHAALDAGINFLDTSDAYCRDDTETGHNERLIAQAIASWPGDRSRIIVATKGGLTRPHGNWIPDGRAKYLIEACEASLRALNVPSIDLYQLHAPDPRIPFATTIRALDALKRDGRIGRIGLCNVNVGQIEEARRITEIAAVQVEMSVWDDGSILSGVADYCVKHKLLLVAHRPLGGHKKRRRTLADPVLADVAARHDGSPAEIALAWLRDLSPQILPIPGPTHVETARSAARGQGILLTDADRDQLDERFPSGRTLRVGGRRSRAPLRADGEVVLVMGLPGAGKSTYARTLVADGYQRLNRDDAGGSLAGLLPVLDRSIASGVSRLVVDNTYVSRKARASVIQAAHARGLPVRCVWLSTSIEDAQVNAVQRMLSRYGRLLTPEEMRTVTKRDVSAFGPAVQFRYQRDLEPPHHEEGFARIDVVSFNRVRDPAYSNRAIIVWCDGVLMRSRFGRRAPLAEDDIEVVEDRAEQLRRFQSDGWKLLGMSWQPEIADQTITPQQADAVFARMRGLTGLAIEVEYCPHGAGPVACWCRKPLPGLGVVFIERHKLDAPVCIYIGSGVQDPGFSRRLGFQYHDAATFL
jgi:aryl-alcohol dehydrogenase-like predicted oxidoreductase/predicted kinase/histidinol phosphatase-like enzyme